jgi:hypothetical protein
MTLERAAMGGWACTNEACPDYEEVKNLDADDEDEKHTQS